MEKMADVHLRAETTEGGLRDLVWSWFTETQIPLILNNGSFPDWFQGFAARKDTEDLLRDKALGYFLIRLSDKAIGYILSYKGHDRCRHFVITQNQDGQFVIAGDCQTYPSLIELIEHHKVNPIQPFGECLTSCGYEVNTSDLYDVINYSSLNKPGLSVQALRTLWLQKEHPPGAAGIQQQLDKPEAKPPALPPKSKTRKGTMSLSQGVPPIPQRGLPQGSSKRSSLPNTASYPSETQTRSEQLKGPTPPVLTSDPFAHSSYPGDLCPVGVTYSELAQVEGRSRSLPKLNYSEEEEEWHEACANQLSCPSISTTSSPASPVKKITCHTYSLSDPREGSRSSSSWSEYHGSTVEMSRSNPLYQSAPAHRAKASSVQYAEVLQRPTSARLPDDTYEQIPGEAVQANMYETLEDLKNKKPKTTWGKSNVNWKKYLPEYMKK